MNRNPITPVSTAPTRQGFYEAELDDGSRVIAEWRQLDKKQGKRWWKYTSAEPTQEKTPHPLEGVCGWRKAEPSAVAAALRREHTLDEHIEAALAHFAKHSDIQVAKLGTPPPNRQVAVGDAVELGNLRGCEVVAVREGGVMLVVTYRLLKREGPEMVDCGTGYRAAHWAELVPKAHFRQDDLVRKPVMHNAWHTNNLSELLGRISAGLDDSPVYQRQYVWTAADKAAFLDSLFSSRDLGRFILVRNPYPQLDEVLDGKQRMNCLWEFFTSRIAYRGVFWHQLTPHDRNRIENRLVQVAELSSTAYSRADLCRIFLDVNAGGVPQTEEHLAQVRAVLAHEMAQELALEGAPAASLQDSSTARTQ